MTTPDVIYHSWCASSGIAAMIGYWGISATWREHPNLTMRSLSAIVLGMLWPLLVVVLILSLPELLLRLLIDRAKASKAEIAAQAGGGGR